MYKKIFCPIDGSETSNRGMREAIELAKDQQAQLCFLHVVDFSVLIMYTPVIENSFDAIRDAGQEILNSAVAAARDRGVSAESRLAEILTGRPAPTIVEEAEKYGADLIVIGTHGRRGISRLLLGSDATGVVSTGKMPVLLVK
jgi:nucleotide-binding universal stress UspA family protein